MAIYYIKQVTLKFTKKKNFCQICWDIDNLQKFKGCLSKNNKKILEFDSVFR